MAQALERLKSANLCCDAHGAPRHQTTPNHAVARRWTHASLKVLVKVSLKCSGNKKKRPTSRQANGELQDTLHVGGLAASHTLHIAALSGATPSCCADGAIVSKTAKSSNQLREEHGITDKRDPLTPLKEQGIVGTESVAESGGVCEALRPPGHPHGDTVSSGQSATCHTGPSLCARQDDECLVKATPRTAGDGDRTSRLQLGRLSLPGQVRPAGHDSNNSHWSQCVTANAGVSPDSDTIIWVDNKQGTGPAARVSKTPRGADKPRESPKNATKTRVSPGATSLGRGPRAIAGAADLGHKSTDPVQALPLPALHKVASGGGKVTCVDGGCVDGDDVRRVEDTKALEDSQLLGALASCPDDAWGRVLGPPLKMRTARQLGTHGHCGGPTEPIGDSPPMPTEPHNKDVRLETSGPLVCLRASAGFDDNDTRPVVLDSLTAHDEEGRHTMAAVLSGSQECHSQGDSSPARDMSVGLVCDSGQGPPHSATKKFAGDALSWHLATRPETKDTKDSPGRPSRPSDWLRRVSRVAGKWAECHPSGPRCVIPGGHHDKSVKEAGQERRADVTPPPSSAPGAPEAGVVVAMRRHNDGARVAPMRGGSPLAPLVAAEDPALGDAPARRGRRGR